MSRKSKKNKRQTMRSDEKSSSASSNVALCSIENWEILCGSGYTPLSQNPEIISAVNKIASLIGGMTIHLMANTNKGDQRIKNELSRKIDINPNNYMTRNTFISAVVRCLLLEGDGNAVIYPETSQGLIQNLFLLPPNNVSFRQDGFGYKILYNGMEYTPNELIHIPINPDPNLPWKGTSYRKALQNVARTLNQAVETKDGFMKSKWKPSIIVKVDSLADEFSSPEGRKKLLDKYVTSTTAGEPWLIPADGFSVDTVKPLSLNDLAIKDSVELDKKTVASILDVPSFILGVGTFNDKEWNNFINTRIKNICTAIQQAYTKTLLISPDWYFRFNHRSLLAYDLQTLSTVGCDLYTRGLIDGNEVRDSIGYSPRDGLDELVILENYIPAGMIGQQKKLNNGGDNDG